MPAVRTRKRAAPPSNDEILAGALGSDKRKSEGVHFTPEGLAEIIARRILAFFSSRGSGRIRVLDPSCGDGGLLAAFTDAVPRSLLGRVELIGVEHDSRAVEIARERLRSCPGFRVIHGDFLELVGGSRNGSLFGANGAREDLGNMDVVIANPPYVRTQVLGSKRSRSLAEEFGLSGRVDLYQPFFVAMTSCLRAGGLLGAVTSNRYLTTLTGKTIREFLADEYEVLEVVDLGDTKLFEAAVLPALFFGRRRVKRGTGAQSVATFVRIYETDGDASGRMSSSICEAIENRKPGIVAVDERVFEIKTGTMTIEPGVSDPWVMATSGEERWIGKVLGGSRLRLSEIGKIRVGIKTTADAVFIRRDWEALPRDQQPEGEVLMRLVSHDEAAKWGHVEAVTPKLILYTHESVGGKRRVVDFSRFPKAWSYLKKHRDVLESRKYVIEAGREWFEIWVPQNPALWAQNKLVFPDISASPKFFLDADGCLVDGNCYWMTLEPGVDPDMLYLVLALANTEFMTRYHDLAFQNKLYAGRRRYLTQYVEKYPLPDPSRPESRELIAVARRLAAGQGTTASVQEDEARVERLAPLAYGLDPVRVLSH